MHVSTHPAGTCCWVELGTTDQNGARRFYEDLFSWSMHDTSMSTGETYTIVKRTGRDVGGLYTLRADDRARGVPPHWLVYLAVDDVDAATPKVTELGGRVMGRCCRIRREPCSPWSRFGGDRGCPG